MTRSTLAIVGLSILAGTYGAWVVADSRSFQLFGTLIDRVETTRPRVALTFDDGPTPAATDSILAILERVGVSATFFFTGAELAANPGLGPRYVEKGHELGNHTYSHKRLLLRSQSFISSEIEATDSLIRRSSHTGPIFFRPPYGKKLLGLPWYLAKNDRTTIMWDVEPDSYPSIAASADRIVDHVLTELRPGSIIILHVMYPSRRESMRAVEGLVRGAREKGYDFVTLSELVGAG